MSRPRRPFSPTGLPTVVAWLVSLAAPALLAAQTAPADADAEVERLARALAGDRDAHLKRVAIWGGASLLAGGVVAAASESDAWSGFGAQTAGWGAVNLGIAAWGLLSEPSEPAEELRAALEDEDGWSHLLLVNLGLNVGYALVGGALVVAADHGLANAEAVRGHGAAVVVQGVGLLVLDGVAWAASRGRLGALRARVGGADAGPTPGSASFTLLSLPVG